MIDRGGLFFLNTDGVFILLLGVAAYLWLWEKEWGSTIRLMISSLVVFAVVVVLKELFLAPRPFVVINTEPLAGLTPLSSFPSFHSALAFSTATSVSFRRRRLGIVLFFVAALIGAGRVWAYVHYPIDVLVGVMIGILIAAFVESLGKPSKVKHR